MFFKAEGGNRIQCEDGDFSGVKPETLVWKTGMAGWERADKVFPDKFPKVAEAPKIDEVPVPNPVMVVASVVPKPQNAPVDTQLNEGDKAKILEQVNHKLSLMDQALPPNDDFEGENWRGYQTCVDAWISKIQRKYPQIKITVLFIPDEKPRFRASISNA